MAPKFGSTLQRLRKQRGFTQAVVAQHLDVARATFAQWERNSHAPEPANVRRLDDLLAARGELVAVAEADRGGSGATEAVPTPPRNLSLGQVLQDVADALVAALVPAGPDSPPGWAHHLGGGVPTPLSTAYVIRTLQMCDDARVDLHALGVALQARESAGGWTNRLALGSRPEATAVVLAALSRLGLVPDVAGPLAKLEHDIGDFSRSRPYVLAVALESTLAVDPAAPLVTTLLRALLDARTDHRGERLWAADASAPAGRVEPSLPHTARATAVLRIARTAGVVGAGEADETNEAIETAVSWIVARDRPDDGTTEILRPEGDDRATDIPIDHFTAAWCVRALAGADGVPAARLHAAMGTLWGGYSPTDRLWTWRAEGSLPSWMTHDAVAALRADALSATPTPIPAELPVAPDPDPLWPSRSR